MHCSKNCFHFLPHLRSNQNYTFAGYNKKFPPVISSFARSFHGTFQKCRYLRQLCHNQYTLVHQSQARSCPGHAKAPHNFFLARRVKEAGSPLIAPKLEREEATGLSHLPSNTNKTLTLEGRWVGTACWRKASS